MDGFGRASRGSLFFALDDGRDSGISFLESLPENGGVAEARPPPRGQRWFESSSFSPHKLGVDTAGMHAGG